MIEARSAGRAVPPRRLSLAVVGALLAGGFLAPMARAQSSGVGAYPHARLENRDVRHVAFAPDDQYLAFSDDDGMVTILDVEADRVVRRFESTVGTPEDLTYGPLGDRIVLAGEDEQVAVYHPLQDRTTARRDLGRDIHAVDAVREPRPAVVAGGDNGLVVVLTPDLTTVRTVRAPNFYDRSVHFVNFGRGGREIFAAAEEGNLAYWRRGSGSLLRTSSLTRQSVVAAGTDPNGRLLGIGVKKLSIQRARTGAARGGNLTARASYLIRIIDWRQGRNVKEITDRRGGELRAMAVAPNHNFLVTGDHNGRIQAWNVSREQSALRLNTDESLRELAISPGGSWLAAVGENGTLQIWETSGLSDPSTSEQVYAADDLLSDSKFQFNSSREPIMSALDSVSLAVLSVESRGMEGGMAETTTNLLTTRLGNYSNIHLIERAQIQQVIDEQKLQQTGLTSPAEAAQIGRILNAGRVLVGSINRLGSSVVISVRLVDTETAEVKGAREIMCNKCQESDLPKALTLLVRSIAGSVD